MGGQRYNKGMTDQKLSEQMKYLFEIEGMTLSKIRDKMHLTSERFKQLRNMTELKRECKKCGKKFVFEISQRFCPACVAADPKIADKRKRNKAHSDRNRRFEDKVEVIEAKKPKYHKVPELHIGDVINIKLKKDKRNRGIYESPSDYHIENGTVTEMYHHGFLVVSDNNVRDFISFTEVKIGKYMISIAGQAINEYRAVVNV
ncbi:MAG TPA: hypothetical protein VEF53_18630 [Patescibacteria group bacterium]|nr:hypothetical protein [Patescibacteria group bacterium]